MTYLSRVLLALAVCTAAVNAQAAACRSGSAATQGSQNGYKRDKKAAEEAGKKERDSSDILGKCVGGISAVMTAPQFPSLSQIFEQI